MLILLSGDVQLNPGPVTPGALQNFNADLCPSVSGTPLVPVTNEQQLSEPGFSLNRLNFVNTRHDGSMNNFSLLGCGNLDRSSVSLTKPAADTTVCQNPAVRRQKLFKTFQTVNHAKSLMGPEAKTEGAIRGGNIKCERVVYNAGNMLEYVGIKIMLSQQMSFNIIGVYRPPSADDTFYDQLTEVLKK